MRVPQETANRIRRRFAGHDYVAFHAPRYAVLLEIMRRYAITPDTSILDIGNSPFTDLAADVFRTRIDNLGLHGEFDTPYGRSYYFDLNQAQDPDKWRLDLPRYDIVVMAEVIEHLYTAPNLVLRYLQTLLADDGVLILQTPNAAVLHNRLELLMGRNPFELIREDTDNPGHFREYTRRELIGFCQGAGFEVESWAAKSYFDFRFHPHHKALRRYGGALNLLYRFLPPTLRPGQTAVLRRAADSGDLNDV